MCRLLLLLLLLLPHMEMSFLCWAPQREPRVCALRLCALRRLPLRRAAFIMESSPVWNSSETLLELIHSSGNFLDKYSHNTHKGFLYSLIHTLTVETFLISQGNVYEKYSPVPNGW